MMIEFRSSLTRGVCKSEASGKVAQYFVENEAATLKNTKLLSSRSTREAHFGTLLFAHQEVEKAQTMLRF